MDTPQGPFALTFDFAVMGAELTLTSTFEGAPPPGGGPAEQTMTLTRAE